MKIELTPEIFAVERWSCIVRSNDNVASFIKELVLELPQGEEVPFRAGGYIQIECPPHELHYRDFDIGEEYRGEWDQFDLWRFVSKVDEPVQRAYSMANYPGERGVIMLNVRVCSPPPNAPEAPPGQMSSYIFGLKPGDGVTISGPFGEFFARPTDNEMCFIGGGAGMAPMRSHVFDQFKRLHTQRVVTFWYGARNGTCSPSGSSSTSSLMKLATLSFERTRQLQRWTAKISGGSPIFMSSLTFTWQASRTPSRASAGLMCVTSVGSSAPPPSFTVTRHTPQVPFPPHADGTKMPLAERVPSKVSPRSTIRDFSRSSLIRTSTLPPG